MFQVYILHSDCLDKYYIGFTSGTIEARLIKHLSKHKGFTGKASDWHVVHTEIFGTKQEAMQREKQLKSWKNKDRIKQLIQKSSTE